MAERWSLYQRHPRFILGFHGTERATVDALVQRHTLHLDQSTRKTEWLGHGIYFWENDPQRALEWAQAGNARNKIEEPDVVGAIIDLGLCLDLTTRVGLDEVAQAYSLPTGADRRAQRCCATAFDARQLGGAGRRCAPTPGRPACRTIA